MTIFRKITHMFSLRLSNPISRKLSQRYTEKNIYAMCIDSLTVTLFVMAKG